MLSAICEVKEKEGTDIDVSNMAKKQKVKALRMILGITLTGVLIVFSSQAQLAHLQQKHPTLNW